MMVPSNLCRFRPLPDGSDEPSKRLLDRELSMLRDSYLFAPRFDQMNDPMEAFFPTDRINDAVMATLLGRAAPIFFNRILRGQIDKFGLISFATSHEALPLWAYYANNFRGFCLEFDLERLAVGGLQNEPLREVTYSRTPGSAIAAATAIGKNNTELIARLSQKRIEWAHEREWRFLTGDSGKRHYLDDALLRVFLGPRIGDEHAQAICDVLRDRPVEVCKGTVQGYELIFETVQPPCTIEHCSKVGSGQWNFDDVADLEELGAFLGPALPRLKGYCEEVAQRPNFDGFQSIHVNPERQAVFLGLQYRLRSGACAYDRRYLDRQGKIVAKERAS